MNKKDPVNTIGSDDDILPKMASEVSSTNNDMIKHSYQYDIIKLPPASNEK